MPTKRPDFCIYNGAGTWWYDVGNTRFVHRACKRRIYVMNKATRQIVAVLRIIIKYSNMSVKIRYWMGFHDSKNMTVLRQQESAIGESYAREWLLAVRLSEQSGCIPTVFQIPVKDGPDRSDWMQAVEDIEKLLQERFGPRLR